MSSLSNNLKTFLYKHSQVVDFLCASLIIILCLIVLLPKVHESFQITSSNSHVESYNVTPELNLDDAHEGGHHHHNHKLPIGEIIICVGFFVFYCLSIGFTSAPATGERQPLLLAKRKVTPYYVEEIRITRRPIDADEACSIGCDEDLRLYRQAEANSLIWPLSAKMSLFGILLAATLIVFDVNIHGLMETIKVFRAAATGALLYVAFFLVLPKGPGCKVCTKDDSEDNVMMTVNAGHLGC